MKLISDKSQNAAAVRLLSCALDQKDLSDTIILTPENATLWAENTLAKLSSKGAISGVSITNATRLFSSVFAGTKTTTSEFSAMLVSRAAQNKKFEAFSKTSKKYGFAREAYELIKLLSQSGLLASQILSNTKTALSTKLNDIASIWQDYNNLIPKNMCDGSMGLSKLTMLAKQGYFEGKTFMFVAYDDMSKTMLDFVEQILKNSKAVFASVVENDNSQTVNSHLADELIDVASKQNCTIVFDRKNTLDTRANQIATNLFAKQKQPAETTGVEVVACKNRKAEAEFVAQSIWKSVQNKNRYNSHEIVVPSREAYGQVLFEALKQKNIPFYEDAPKSVDYHPLFRLVDKFLQLGFSPRVQNMLSVLKNPLLKQDINVVSTYQNFCEKYGVEFEDYQKPLVVGQMDGNFETAKQVHAMCGKIAKLLPSAQANVGEYVEAINKFLQKHDIATSILEFSQKQTDPQEKEITSRVLEELSNLLEQITLVLGDTPTTCALFHEIYQSGVQNIRMRLVPPILDGVAITDLDTSKHSAIENMYVLGATEGDFPTILPDNGILTDTELAEMESSLNLKVGPTVSHVNELQKFKAKELFCLATNNLVVTFPKQVGGEQKTEAIIVSALREICLKNGQPLPISSDKPQSLVGLKEMFLEKAKTVDAAKQIVSYAKSRLKSNKSLFGFPEVFGSCQKALEETNNLNQTTASEIQNLVSTKELFFKNGTTSISELESYFACPYMHFAKYGLGVKESEQATIRALDIGNFLHKCIERVTNVYIQKKHISDTEFAKLMKQVLTELVKEEKYQAKVNALQLTALKNEACRLCYAVLNGIECSGFKPVYAELSFKDGHSLPSVPLTKNVKLEGKIDRMDTCGNMARLIDYKTGQIDLGFDNLYYGKKVQLFAYLLSVIKDGKYKPVGVFYLPIKSTFKKDSNMLEAYKLQGYFSSASEVVEQLDTSLSLDNPKSALVEVSYSTSKENKLLGKKVIKPQNHIMTEEQLVGLAQYAKTIMTKAVEEIADGNIMPSPIQKGDAKPCDYCPYKASCKISDKQQNIRKQAEKVSLEQILGAK